MRVVNLNRRAGESINAPRHQRSNDPNSAHHTSWRAFPEREVALTECMRFVYGVAARSGAMVALRGQTK